MMQPTPSIWGWGLDDDDADDELSILSDIRQPRLAGKFERREGQVHKQRNNQYNQQCQLYKLQNIFCTTYPGIAQRILQQYNQQLSTTNQTLSATWCYPLNASNLDVDFSDVSLLSQDIQKRKNNLGSKRFTRLYEENMTYFCLPSQPFVLYWSLFQGIIPFPRYLGEHGMG